MTNTIARITRKGKHFEIMVDLESALKYKKNGEGSIASIVLTDGVFENLKAGERANHHVLEFVFGTSDFEEVCKKIIREGEIVLPTEYLKKEQDKKYKQIVDWLSSLIVSPEGRPYAPDRIMKAMKEAHVNVKNKPIDEQIGEIIDKIRKILPLKIEVKKAKVIVPAQYSARAYPILKDYIKKEEWKENGNLEAIVEVPSAMVFDFYERLNKASHGSIMSEEIKD